MAGISVNILTAYPRLHINFLKISVACSFPLKYHMMPNTLPKFFVQKMLLT